MCDQYVQLLLGEQLRLLGYITALLGDPEAAENVLQETNLVLWRKSDQFQMGTSFSAWAHKVAYWQVQAYVRDKCRDRHVFSEKLISQLEGPCVSTVSETARRVALRHCLKTASKDNLQLLRARYEDDLPIAALADRFGKKLSAVKVRLMRIRQALQKCIEEHLAGTT